MSCFDYPIDAGQLLSKKRKIRKELEGALCNTIAKNVAVLGGSTTNEIVDQLYLFMLHNGIKCNFYTSEYGQFWEDAMFPPDELLNFHPDVIYIHTNWRNINEFPQIGDSLEKIDELLDQEFSRLNQMWTSLSDKFGCIIIQNNYDRPNYRLLGNRDVWDKHGRTNYIKRLNIKLYEYANVHDNFYVNDIDYLSAEFGLTKWNDPTYWHMYKYAMNIQAIPYIAKSVSDIIKSILGKNKKLLALDMDNTLWGGIIGDDGVEGIQLGPEVPTGQVYLEFQKYCKSLQQTGVVLAIDSKNEESNALLGLNHPDSALHAEDFVCIKANWEPKDKNLSDIANELDLGIDSFVFVDDNPAERHIIRKQLPGVSVPEVEKPDQFIQVLDHSGFFEVTTLSSEDLQKTRMYHAKAEAKQQLAAFSDYGDYLDSLEMAGVVKPFDTMSLQRVAQLTNKSNQFNLTTLRCTEADIASMAEDPKWITLYGKLSDKFTEHGIVTVVAGEIIEYELHIRLWLMSCRVLKRDLEYLMLDTLVECANDKAIKSIIGYYYPSAKNNMVKDFYRVMGFEMVEEKDDGSSTWKLDTYNYKKKNRHINTEV